MGRFDLAGVFIGTLASVSAVLLLPPSPIRTGLVLPLVLFYPGYAFVAAVFPRTGSGNDGDREPAAVIPEPARGRLELGTVERVVVSVAASVAIVPAVAAVANFTPYGIRLHPILAILVALTILLTVLAYARQRQVPVSERCGVTTLGTGASFVKRYLSRDRSFVSSGLPFGVNSRRGQLLNVLLVLSVVFFLGSVGAASQLSTQGQTFTEFYVVTENETGAYVAQDFPQEITNGTEPVYLTVENGEGERTTYTVVAELQRVQTDGEGVRVLEETRLSSFHRTVPANETARIRHDPDPAMSGDRLRLVYLLYRGDPPTEPSPENAYRHLQLWVSAD